MSEEYKSNTHALYDQSYFSDRMSNNWKRLEQFKIDANFVNQHATSGKLCDVGCGTGEFLKTLNWTGEFFGMEVSEFAKQISSNFINYERNISNSHSYFDVIIFRGSIQHLSLIHI